jgi:hypothetical protein
VESTLKAYSSVNSMRAAFIESFMEDLAAKGLVN